MRRKEARDRESPQSGRKTKIIGEDMMTAEEFFGGYPQSSPKKKIGSEDMMKAEEFFA